MPHRSLILHHKGLLLNRGSPMKKGGAPALLLDNKQFEYPIKGLTKKMKMVSMSGGSVIRTQPVKRPIKILL